MSHYLIVSSLVVLLNVSIAQAQVPSCSPSQVLTGYNVGTTAVVGSTGTVSTTANALGTPNGDVATLNASSSITLDLSTTVATGGSLLVTYRSSATTAPLQLSVATAAGGPFTALSPLPGVTTLTTTGITLPANARYVRLAAPAAVIHYLDAVTYPVYQCVMNPAPTCGNGQVLVTYQNPSLGVVGSTGSVSTTANVAGFPDANTAYVVGGSSLVIDLGSVVAAGNMLSVRYSSGNSNDSPYQVLTSNSVNGPFINIGNLPVPPNASLYTGSALLPVNSRYVQILNPTGNNPVNIDAVTTPLYACTTPVSTTCPTGQQSGNYAVGTTSVNSFSGSVTNSTNLVGVPDGSFATVNANSNVTVDLGTLLAAGNVLTATFNGPVAGPLQVQVATTAAGSFTTIGQLQGTGTGDQITSPITLPLGARYVRFQTSGQAYTIDALTYQVYTCVTPPITSCPAGQQLVDYESGAQTYSNLVGTVSTPANLTGTIDGQTTQISANASVVLDLGSVVAGGNTLNITYSANSSATPLQVLVATTAAGPFTNIGQVSGNLSSLGTASISLPIDARYVQLQAEASTAYTVDAITHTIVNCVSNPAVCPAGQQPASYQSGATGASATAGTITNPASVTGMPDGNRATLNANSSLMVDLGSSLPAGTELILTYYSYAGTAPLQFLIASTAGGPYTNIAQIPGSANRTTYTVTLPSAARYVQLQTTGTIFYVDALTNSVFNCVLPPSTTCASGQQTASYAKGAVNATTVTGTVTNPENATGTADNDVATQYPSTILALDMGNVLPAGAVVTVTYRSQYTSANADPAQVLVATTATGPYQTIGSLPATGGSTLQTQSLVLPIGAQFVRIATGIDGNDTYYVDALTFPVYTCIAPPNPTCSAGQQLASYVVGAQSAGTPTGSVTAPDNLVGTPDGNTATILSDASIVLNLGTVLSAGKTLTFTYNSYGTTSPLQVLVSATSGGPYTTIGRLEPNATANATASLLLPINAQYVQLVNGPSTYYYVDAVTYPVFVCVANPVPTCSPGQQVARIQMGAAGAGATTGTVTNGSNVTGFADNSLATINANSSLIVNLGSIVSAGTTLNLPYNSDNTSAPLQVLVATTAGGSYTNVAQLPGTTANTTATLTLPFAIQYVQLQTTGTTYRVDAITRSMYSCVTLPTISCSAGQTSASYQQGAVSVNAQTGSITNAASTTGAPDAANAQVNQNATLTFDMGSTLAAGTPLTFTYYSYFAGTNVAPLQVLAATTASGSYTNIGQLTPTSSADLTTQQLILPISAQYIRLVTGTTGYDIFFVDAVTAPIYVCVPSPVLSCPPGQQAVATYPGSTTQIGTTGNVNAPGSAVGSPDGTDAILYTSSTLTLDLGTTVTSGNTLTINYYTNGASSPLRVLVATTAAGPFTDIGEVSASATSVVGALVLPLNTRYVRLQNSGPGTNYYVDAVTYSVYTCAATTNTSGLVFLDGNLDGVKQPTEQGVGGITVNAYDASNTLVASTVTSYGSANVNIPAGYYTFTSLAAGQPYRLEFVNPNQPQYNETVFSNDSPTSVQFVQGQTQNHNFGLYVPSTICSTLPDPRVVTACGIPNGAPTDAPSVVSFTYYDRGTGAFSQHTATSHTDDIRPSQVGIPIGLGAQRGTDLVFLSSISTNFPASFPLPPDGASAIYVAKYDGPGQTFNGYKLLTKLADLGINVGTLATSVGLGPVGVQGLGGADLSEDGRTLYVVNMYTGKLVRMDVSGVNYNSLPATAPTVATELTPPASLLQPCTGGVWRPTALKQFGGKLYMGGVCDAEYTKSTADLKGLVLAYDPTTNTWSQALSYPINFAAGSLGAANEPQVSWAATDLTSGSAVFEPVMLDLAFGDDGVMIIGTTNRMVYDVTTSNDQHGYVLGAYPNGNGTWTLENGGVLGPYVSQAMNNPSVASNGPGGRYYFQQTVQVSGHLYAYHGGLFVKPGTTEVMGGYTDPATGYSIGIAYLDYRTGNIAYSNTLANGVAKQARITGVHEACDLVPPLEIGSRVWKDTNNDGIQNANEPSLAGVTVQLTDNGGNVLATATTDAAGNYVFSSLNKPSNSSQINNLPLTQYTPYFVRVTSLGTDPSTTGLTLTGISPAPGETAGTTDTGTTLNNNDAFLVNGLPTISLRTGVNGQTNHTYDFGFLGQPCNLTVIASVVGSSTVTAGTPVTLTTSITPAGSYTYAWTGPASVTISPTNAGTVTTSGLPVGVNTFIVSVTSSPSCQTTVTISVTVVAPTLVVSVTPGTCSSATNSYTLTGTISLTSTLASSLTVTDGTSTTTLSTAANQASTPFSLSGLVSDGASHTVTVSGNGFSPVSVTYAAPVSCSVAPALALNVTPGTCNSATNGYTITGTISLTAAVAATLTIRDGNNTTTVAVTAGQPSASFSLSGLVSDGIPHTVTVSGTGYAPASTTYVAPVSCLVAPALALSVTPGTCSSATNGYTLTGTLAVTANAAGTLTISAGSSMTTVIVTAGQTSTSFTLTGLVSDGVAHAVTVSGSGYSPVSATYTAPASCSVAPALALRVTPGACSSATNSYAVTGTISLTAAVASTLTISDGTSATTVPVTTGQTSANFSLTGLVSDGVSHTVTVSGTGYSPASTTYAAPVSCSVAPALALNVTPGMCNSATNAYMITGTISLTAAVPSTLAITDGSSTTTVAVTAGQPSASFNLSGLVSNGMVHTVTVSGTGYGTVSTTYTAPASCSVAPALSLAVTLGTCNSATNGYAVTGTITLTAAVASTLTLTDGTSTTTVVIAAGQPSASFSMTGLTSNGASHTVTVSGTGYSPASATYTAPASCSVAPSLALRVTPGTCSSATNAYILTGTVNLTASVASTLIVSDGTTTTTVSVTAGQTSADFSLSGITSDQAIHTVSVSGTGYSPVSATYTAPFSCSVAPIFDLALRKTLAAGQIASVTPGASVTFTVTVFNQGQVTATAIQLADYIPAGLTLADANWTATGGIARLTAPIASLSAGASVARNIVFTVGTGALGDLVNRAEIAAATGGTDIDSTPDTNPTNDAGGAPNTPSDDVITGNGTGTPNGTDPATDEDDADPAVITVTAAPVCSVNPVVTAGSCTSATNTYSLTATVTLANTVAGVLTISTQGRSVTAVVAGNQATLTFTTSFTGLSSNGASYTLVASLPGCDTAVASYNAPASCSVAPALSVAVTPGTCSSATNSYTLTGTLNLTAAVAATLTITDGASTTTVSVTAGQSSADFGLAGLNSDNRTHTVIVNGTGYNPASATYTAPLSCSVAPTLYLSLTPGTCSSATNSYSATGLISVTAAVASSLTVTDGITSTTVAVTTGQTSATFSLGNFDSNGTVHTVTASGAGYRPVSATYAAPVSCSVAPTLALEVAPGACNASTNTYTVIGAVSLTAAVASSLTITDGSSLTTLSVTAGQSSAIFTLTGLASDRMVHTVVVSGSGYSPVSATYTAPESCTVAPTLALLVTPGTCSSATNSYSVTGTISLTAAVASTLTITDGTSTTTVSVTAGQSSASFSLSGINSDGLVHTVTVIGRGYNPVSVTYVAPTSCSLAVALSVTPGVCSSVTNQYSISGIVSLTNAVAGPAIITSGAASTTVTVLTGSTTVPYSLTGLMSDGASHTISVGYAGKTASVTYTAPVSCSVAPASLGDFVFEDSNHNGQQNTGEPGIPGVTVTLLASGAPVTSTTTNSSGLYSFTGLTPGVPYSVSFTAPAGYSATVQNVGPDATDSDGNPATGLTGTYSLTANEYNPTVDMGYYRPASLGDYVFADNNKNGLQDSGDTPIQGAVVTLLDGTNTPIASTTTNASGLYSFTGLTPGVPYSVSFTTPTNLSATTANVGSDDSKDSDPVGGVTAPVTLTSGENNTTLDAGFYQPLGSIGSTVTIDLNKNGQRDPNEPGVDGVTVRLLRETTPGNYTVVSTMVTTGGGHYLFTDLPAGTYLVEFVKSTLPDHYSFTTPNASGVPSNMDSDANVTTGRSAPITVVPGNPAQQDLLAIDAGIFDAGCPPSKCVPFVLKQTVRAKRIGDAR